MITGRNDNNMTLKEYVNQKGKRSGYDINGNEWTPLIIAAEKEHFQIVKYLIEQGEADPNIADSNGVNALHLAASNNRTNTELIQFLLNLMTIDSINKEDNDGLTPLDCCYDCYEYNRSPIRQEIIALLRSKGGIANKYDENGNRIADEDDY